MNKQEYISIQNGEKLDLEKVSKLKDNAMLKVKPELWIEWDFEKNDELGFNIWEITKGSDKKAWWICNKCDSNYYSTPTNRLRNRNCPYCSSNKVNHTNSLASLNPILASEWHPSKNSELKTSDVLSKSNKKAWWKGLCGHEWEAVISSRANGRGCPYCSNRIVNNENCLANTNKKLFKEWNFELNKNTSPYKITEGSHKKAWWICDKGHEWEAQIKSRNNGLGCPYCSNQKVLKDYNDMWTTTPMKARLLYNQEDGYKYMQNSNLKLEWRCQMCNMSAGYKVVSAVNIHTLACDKCRPNCSLSERIMKKVLDYIGVDYQFDKSFNWSNRKRYDFYIPELNTMIETHGGQHYIKGFDSVGGRTLEEEKLNDTYKRKLAINNGIDNYIELDCRYSCFNYIRKSIVNSELSNMLDLSIINWNLFENEFYEDYQKK